MSEYPRTIVPDAQQADAASRLETLLLEGLLSGGDDMEADAQFWTDLKAEAASLLAKRKG